MDSCQLENKQQNKNAQILSPSKKKGLVPVTIIPHSNGLTTLQPSCSLVWSRRCVENTISPSFLAVAIECTGEHFENRQGSRSQKSVLEEADQCVGKPHVMNEIQGWFCSHLSVDDTANNWDDDEEEDRQDVATPIPPINILSRGTHATEERPSAMEIWPQWQIDRMIWVDEWVTKSLNLFEEDQCIVMGSIDAEFLAITQLERPSYCETLSASTIEFIWDNLVEDGPSFRMKDEDCFADDELSIDEKPRGSVQVCQYKEIMPPTKVQVKCFDSGEADISQEILHVPGLQNVVDKKCTVGDIETWRYNGAQDQLDFEPKILFQDEFRSIKTVPLTYLLNMLTPSLKKFCKEAVADCRGHMSPGVQVEDF